MAKAYKCDRCGEIREHKENYIVLYPRHTEAVKSIDFCDPCYQAFLAWLKDGGGK